MKEPRGHRRPLLAALLLVAAALVGWLATHGRPGARLSPAQQVLSPSDPRVAGAFDALKRDGLAAALDTLERRAAGDSAVLRNGHQLAHALGRQALLATGGDASVLGQCRPVFASGCYHGVIEAYLHARGRIDMAELERMCAAAGDAERPGPVYECMHGLGHGVMGAVGLDAPVALRHCDALSTPTFATSCHQGVFMEAITSAVAGPGAQGAHVHAGEEHHGPAAGRLTLDPADPYAPCDRFADPYAESCWLFQGFVILRREGFDPARALHMCDAAPGGRAGRCYESIGHQLTGLFQRDDRWIVEQCGKGSPGLAAHCAGGAALALVGADWSGGRVVGFCRAVPGEWKDVCYRAGWGLLGDVATGSQIAALCGSAESAYIGRCREAAGEARN